MDVVVGFVGRVVVLNRFSCRAAVGLQVWWAGVCFCHLLWVEWLPTNPSPPNVKPLWLGGADGSRVAGLQVLWAGVCQMGGNARQAAKTNASPQNVLLIITEFIR